MAHERARRMAHLRRPGPDAEEAFVVALAAHPELGSFGHRALRFARALEYDHPGQSAEVYLAHPIRVATLYLDFVDLPAPQGVVTALIHNVLEVGEVDEAGVAGTFGEEVVLALRTLTVDRTRRWEGAYLSVYYEAIASAPPWVGQVKVLDKLDNLYLLCLNPDDEVRRRYLDEIERWILPLALEGVPGAVERLRLLMDEARRIGHRPLESWPESPA